MVTEFRNLVQRDDVDAVVGYVSSGSCLAVTPVAEELKPLTVFESAARRASSRRSRATTCSASTRTPPWTTSRRAQYVLRKMQGHHRSIPASTRTTPGARIPGATSSAMKELDPEGDGRQGAVPQTVRRRIRRRDLDAADFEVAGRAFELLGRRSRSLHLSGGRAGLRSAFRSC